MILIDTHVVIWVTDEVSLLSKLAAHAIAQSRREGDVAIADVTFREIAFLVARGRISISQPIDIYLRFVETIFHVLPIDSRVADRSLQFGSTYPNDQADQIIGATAVVHGLRLVTKDLGIRRSGEVNCIW